MPWFGSSWEIGMEKVQICFEMWSEIGSILENMLKHHSLLGSRYEGHCVTGKSLTL